MVQGLGDYAPLVNVTAVAALIFFYWRSQRDHTATLAEVRGLVALMPKLLEVMTAVQVTQAGLLEYERMRFARYEQWRARRAPAAPDVDEWSEPTRPHEMPTPPLGSRTSGYRAPSKPSREG